MIWIKLTHTIGADYINLEQVYRILQTASTDITFYDANSILPITYSFSTAQETVDVLDKLESLAQIIDIDKLADQG
jgi:phenylalanine-4-hydroxylase